MIDPFGTTKKQIINPVRKRGIDVETGALQAIEFVKTVQYVLFRMKRVQPVQGSHPDLTRCILLYSGYKLADHVLAISFKTALSFPGKKPVVGPYPQAPLLVFQQSNNLIAAQSPLYVGIGQKHLKAVRPRPQNV